MVSEIIDAEANAYVVTITILMPMNSKSTTYPITVKAGNQVEAMSKAIEEWKSKTGPDAFQTVDVKKVK